MSWKLRCFVRYGLISGYIAGDVAGDLPGHTRDLHGDISGSGRTELRLEGAAVAVVCLIGVWIYWSIWLYALCEASLLVCQSLKATSCLAVFGIFSRSI